MPTEYTLIKKSPTAISGPITQIPHRNITKMEGNKSERTSSNVVLPSLHHSLISTVESPKCNNNGTDRIRSNHCRAHKKHDLHTSYINFLQDTNFADISTNYLTSQLCIATKYLNWRLNHKSVKRMNGFTMRAKLYALLLAVIGCCTLFPCLTVAASFSHPGMRSPQVMLGKEKHYLAQQSELVSLFIGEQHSLRNKRSGTVSSISSSSDNDNGKCITKVSSGLVECNGISSLPSSFFNPSVFSHDRMKVSTRQSLLLVSLFGPITCLFADHSYLTSIYGKKV